MTLLLRSELVTERTGLEAKLGRDYGPDDVFLPLDGQCFSTAADKYTYEVCPFEQAAQKEGAGSTRYAAYVTAARDEADQSRAISAIDKSVVD